jgi:hypothetical protein
VDELAAAAVAVLERSDVEELDSDDVDSLVAAPHRKRTPTATSRGERRVAGKENPGAGGRHGPGAGTRARP